MFPFNEQNAKKQAFVDNARTEREQREQQRIKQKEEQKLSQSAIVIQKSFRKRLNKKQNFKNLRNLWDTDSGFSAESNNPNNNSLNSLEILLLAKLLFAFFNPKQDSSDNVRFSHLCKLILSSTSPSQNSSSSSNKGDQSNKIVIPFHFLLLNERYGNITLNLMKEILWKCVERIIGYANDDNNKSKSNSLYLSGTEIRLLIYFLDPKIYIIKGNLPISTLLGQHLSIFHNFLLQKGLYILIGSGMFLRVDSMLNLKSRGLKVKLSKDDEKKLNSTNLWMSACLRCCLFLLDSNSGKESLHSEKNKLIMFIIHIMSTPCLVSSLDGICLDMLKKYNIPSKIIETMRDNDSLLQILNGLTGDDALFLIGNIVELMMRSDLISLSVNETQSANPSTKFYDFIEIIVALLQRCQQFVSSKQSNTHYQYHPIFKWYADSSIPNSYFSLIITQLEFLWQRPFILKAFNHILNFKPTTKDQNGPLKSLRKNSFSDKKVSLISGKVTIYAIETQVVCRLYISLSELLADQKRDIFMNLTYCPSLVPCLWNFLTCLGPKGNMEIFLSESVVKDPQKEPLMGILELFCQCCNILLLTVDDEELYDTQIPFSLEKDIIPMSIFFNKFCFAILSHSSPEGHPPTIFESARKVLLRLHLKDTRRPFTGENLWLLIKDPKRSLPKSLKDLFKKSSSSNNNNNKDQMGTSFLERIRVNDPTSIKILNLLPHTIPFETRLDIFRDYLKTSIPNNPDAPGIVIRVRRDHVLDDGYKHLGGLISAKIKGRIRVKFVNETGAEEDGVDQGGPFKEFITQLIAEAFDPSCGLFDVTPDKSLLYPNHQNTSTKIALYSFLGKMIARAIQEGILVDVQFAGFFLSKMSGRAVFLEDLIGLNDELWKNLMFLKKYDENVEDLGLFFAVDEEVDGKIISKDLRLGGSHMPVNNDNKIQYLYLMADYKLNQQTKEQTRAFINGFQSMIPENWLRIFSPPELQRVLSGEDVDWDVSDLRKYTAYHNGYFDKHISIRNFWSILEEMNSKDKSAFLKFVTSCSKPPLGGFKYLQPQFTIRMISCDLDSSAENPNRLRSRLGVKSLLSSIGNKSASKARLPMSSTCFNLLKLPSYSQKSVMKEKLKYAINSNTGFELS